MGGYGFARVYVDAEDRDAVRAVVPATTADVIVEVRGSGMWPSSDRHDFTGWRTNVEIWQRSDEIDLGIVAVCRDALVRLRDAGFAAVISASFEDECRLS